jgi:hypothetical protein
VVPRVFGGEILVDGDGVEFVSKLQDMFVKI